MQPPLKHSWINLTELKDHLTTKLGPEKSKQYFDYLKRFLSLKLSKLEFDKLCLRTVGRENIPLHNQLIRSILKNACTRKSPPPPPTAGDHSTTVGNKKGYDENGLIPVIHSKHQTESLHRKSGKEVSSSRTLLHAPLGIPYWPVVKASSSASKGKSVGVYDSGDLIETIQLRERMEQLAAIQGLQQVSMDCTSVLNNGLEAYLKRLIRSFSELNGARSGGAGQEPIKNSSLKHQGHLRPLNGVRPGHQYQIQNRSWPLDTTQEHEPKRSISLLDFSVAMNLNPQQLGKDWPMLLEKICTHTFKN